MIRVIAQPRTISQTFGRVVERCITYEWLACAPRSYARSYEFLAHVSADSHLRREANAMSPSQVKSSQVKSSQIKS